MSWLKTATRFHKESTKWISPPQKSYPPPHRLLQPNQPKIDIGIGVEIQKAARLSTSTRQPTLVRALIHCIPGMGLVLTTRNAPPGLCTCTASCFAIAIALALAAILQTSPQTKTQANSLKISLLPLCLCLCLCFEGGTEGVYACCLVCGAWPDGKGLRVWMRFWDFYLWRKDFWPTVTAACKCGWCYLVGCPNVWSWLQIPICMHRPKSTPQPAFWWTKLTSMPLKMMLDSSWVGSTWNVN